MCGGEDRGVPCCSEGGQSTQKLDGVDLLTLKKVSVRGGGQKKESERANNTGQVRVPCQTGRQRESCRCAGWQTKKYRRPDRPKRVETLKSAGVCGTACIGREKQEKFWEVRQATHTQDGQDRELCPNLHLTVEVLHLTTPPNPS